MYIYVFIFLPWPPYFLGFLPSFLPYKPAVGVFSVPCRQARRTPCPVIIFASLKNERKG